MVRIPPFQGGGSCSIHGSCNFFCVFDVIFWILVLVVDVVDVGLKFLGAEGGVFGFWVSTE